jgi:WS/DGAT/MGAT family acyltransferase
MCKLLIVERPPGTEPLALEGLRRYVGARLGSAPRLAQKLVPTPFRLANPVWVDDPAFDVANHVRGVETRAPVDRGALLEIVAGLIEQRLDRTRPLWTIDLVEELADGRAALIWRIHHSMADGLTAFRLGSAAIWTTEPAAGDEPAARWRAGPEPRRLALAALGARDRAGGLFREARATANVVRSPRRVGRVVAAAARMPAVLLRELRPGAPWEALDHHPSAKRVVATTSVPLADLKRIERSFGEGITVNDVVLSVVGGGLRRWLEGLAEDLSGIRAKVPASLHRQDPTPDAIGNHDSFMFVDLAVADLDPVERLRDVNRATRDRKLHHDPEVLYDFFHDLHAIARPLERLAERWAMSPRMFALNVSNCPGPPTPIFVLGRRVEELYSFAEIADRHALRVAVVSVAGMVSFGLCADRAVAGDLASLARGIEGEIDELLAAATAVTSPR